MRSRHYSPQISRALVCALYHEAKMRCVPMTRLTDTLLWDALANTAGLRIAEEQFSSLQRGTASRRCATRDSPSFA